MAALVIDLYAGEVRRNIWCDGCLTSARVEVDVMTLSARGVTVITTVKRCLRCDYPNA